MNRQNRRHPTHPLLPIIYPEKKRIVEGKRKKSAINSKGFNCKKKTTQ